MGCDVDAASPRVVVETEQKFLVDMVAFEAMRASLRRRRVRQCYVAVQGDSDGWEVRYRETTATLPSKVGQFPGFTCTMKRRRGDSAISRDEIEFAIGPHHFHAIWAASSWRVEKDRYDGAAVGDWTIDVFTTGPLQGVAVAELELPEGYGSVLEYLTMHSDADPLWPAWLAKETHGIKMYHHDLTAERVNLVAAGVIEKSERLRKLLRRDALRQLTALTEEMGLYDLEDKAATPCPTPPRQPKLTRQGVRDLGYSKRGGVL